MAGRISNSTRRSRFQVTCETQDEIDYFWSKLSEGGEESRCGWLKDKYGLSWQVVPAILPHLLTGADTAKSERAMARADADEKVRHRGPAARPRRRA